MIDWIKHDGGPCPLPYSASCEIESRNSPISRADAVDAARYRWPRDVGDATWKPLGLQPGCTPEHIDAAIEAAIGEANG